MIVNKINRYSINETKLILKAFAKYGTVVLKDEAVDDAHTSVIVDGIKVGNILFKRFVFKPNLAKFPAAVVKAVKTT